ncbi:MAG: TolC family protein, partial [Rhodothermales bacterium]
ARAQGEMLTLQDAVDLAVENNRLIKLARNDADIAANEYSLGNAGLLPTISMSAQQSLSSFRSFSSGEGDETRLGTIQTLDVALNAGVTLFDGFGQFATYRRLESQMEQVELASEGTMEDVLADVVLAYYDLVRQQEQIEVQREAIGISEERLRIAELRRDLGSASELEVRRAQVDLNADRAALLRQEISLSSAKTSFSRLLAREGGFNFSVADTIYVRRDLNPDEIESIALRRNRSLAYARQAEITADLSRAEERADWLPTVRLQAGYALNDFTEEIGLPAARPPGLNYGLSASWGIFDGFNRKRRIQNASIRLRNAQLLVEDAQTEILTRLENAYQNYRNS